MTLLPGVTYEVQSAGTLLPAQPDSFSAASATVLTNNPYSTTRNTNQPAMTFRRTILPRARRAFRKSKSASSSG